MATTKVKGTSKKIKELKGIEDIRPSRVTDQELAQLQSAIKTIDNLTAEVGGIEVRKHSLLKAMESVHSRLEAQRIQIESQYGTDNVNLQTGEISYNNTPTTKIDNVKADKKD